MRSGPQASDPSARRELLHSSGSEGDGDSQNAAISAEARRIVFQSQAMNFATSDSNAVEDIFLSNRLFAYVYPTIYCTGKLNSQGCVPAITSSGALGGAPILALHVPGALVYCQWWGRDPGFPAPLNTTLSDALHYWVEP